MQEILDYIKQSFNDRVAIQEKRPNIYQLLLPIYHEDGDMIDLFIVPKGGDDRQASLSLHNEVSSSSYELCDFGMTLMRLSYSYEIDTPNKESILQKILKENKLTEENGNIKFETNSETIFTDVMHIAQALAKIGSMRYFKREVVESLFYELLDEFIVTELQEYNPQKDVLPLPNRDDLQADYQFKPNGHPVYLFGVKDIAKARLATISCLEYQMNNLNFRSFVVHQDFENLPKKDIIRLTSACDKQFISFEDFKQNAKMFLNREKVIA